MSNALASASTSQVVTLPYLPELFDSNFLDVLLPPKPEAKPDEPVKQPEPAKVDPAPPISYVDALKKEADAANARTRTDNGDPAFASTGSATLDAFQALAPQSETSKLPQLLKDAWTEDPDLTLHMIWNARSIHDGKGEKELFYHAFGWLTKHHPRTALHNLPLLVKPVCRQGKAEEGTLSHGYYKDLLNILALVARQELDVSSEFRFLHHPRGKKAIKKAKEAGQEPYKQTAKAQQAADTHASLKKHLEKRGFRALFITVARIFAEQLAADLDVLKQIKATENKDDAWALTKKLSLAAKWAPTPGAAHDKVTNISSAIALLLFSSGALQQPNVDATAGKDTMVRDQDMHALRATYSRHVLTPLRRALALPEPLMSAGKWNEIHYGRVASMAMKANSERFITHNPEGFEKYLTDVESGTKSISGATLMPHMLVASVMEFDQALRAAASSGDKKTKASMLAQVKAKLAESQLRVFDAQWKTLVGRLRESGALEGALAVCDVSGSMGSIHDKPTKDYTPPVLPAVALSLVLAQLAKPPFAGGFISFSATPQFETVDVDAGLRESVTKMMGADWGMNTDLRAVFLDLLLPIAKKHKIKQDDMVKRLFIFSDMQFDAAYSGDWQGTHASIETAYKNAGYEVPEIVYWNLAAQDQKTLRPMPVQADTPGVAMMNGFSPAMLKVFMGDEEQAEEAEEGWDMVVDESKPVAEQEKAKMDPITIMKKALNKESFSGLVVLD